MDIYVREIDNRGVFDAYLLDGSLLVRRSAAPLLTAARSLLAMGYMPDLPLCMWHVGHPFAGLTTTIGAAADLEVTVGKYGAPKLRKLISRARAAPLSEAAE